MELLWHLSKLYAHHTFTEFSSLWVVFRSEICCVLFLKEKMYTREVCILSVVLCTPFQL